jgi:hypothetical protein
MSAWVISAAVFAFADAFTLRKLLGPYQLNLAELTRCAVCGVARHSDPAVTKSLELAPHFPASNDAGRTCR